MGSKPREEEQVTFFKLVIVLIPVGAHNDFLSSSSMSIKHISSLSICSLRISDKLTEFSLCTTGLFPTVSVEQCII